VFYSQKEETYEEMKEADLEANNFDNELVSDLNQLVKIEKEKISPYASRQASL
jgi:hypothetical protein